MSYFIFSEPRLDVSVDAVLTSFKDKLARPQVMETGPSNGQILTDEQQFLDDLLRIEELPRWSALCIFRLNLFCLYVFMVSYVFLCSYSLRNLFYFFINF